MDSSNSNSNSVLTRQSLYTRNGPETIGLFKQGNTQKAFEDNKQSKSWVHEISLIQYIKHKYKKIYPYQSNRIIRNWGA